MLAPKIFPRGQIDCDGFPLRAKIDPYSNITEGDKVFVSADAARRAVIRMPDSLC
jgi:hypothetical protein